MDFFCYYYSYKKLARKRGGWRGIYLGQGSGGALGDFRAASAAFVQPRQGRGRRASWARVPHSGRRAAASRWRQNTAFQHIGTIPRNFFTHRRDEGGARRAASFQRRGAAAYARGVRRGIHLQL